MTLLSQHPTRTRDRRSQAGFTLVELMVAITIFAIIALAAYAIYDAARWTFKRGSEASDTQQRTRIGFDRMASDLRLAGYDFNRDGDQTPYSDQADEQIEYLGQRAIAFRANFDAEDEQSGREWDPSQGPPEGTGSDATSGYETSVAYLEANQDEFGFPMVTTANDEIVIYALAKTGVNDSITLKLDTSKPRNADKEALGDNVTDEEESIRICNIALDHDDPPYTLQRITFTDENIPASGNSCLSERYIVRTPLADGIRSMTFNYYDARDRDYYCINPNTDGTCADADQIKFVDVGGEDDLENEELLARNARSEVRRVAIELVGMTENPDFRYTDPEDQNSPASQHRKTRLLADVNPPNLGKAGQYDLGAVDPTQVEDVSACSGQCGFVRVTWQENPRNEQILGYVVNLFEIQCASTTVVRQVASRFVTGRDAYDRTGYLYTVFDGTSTRDLLEMAREPDIDNRPCLAVQVTAKNVNGADGPPSDSNPATDDAEVTPLSNEPGAPHSAKMYDETRPAAPDEFVATGVDPDDYDTDSDGVPDDNGNGVNPETNSSSDFYPLTNGIRLSWEEAAWVLDEDSSNSPVTNVDATTLPALGQGTPVPGCHVEQDPDGNERTPLHEVNALANSSSDLKELSSSVPDANKQGKYLIFRSTEANFEPRPHHLIAVTESTEFLDTTVHHYRSEGGQEVFRYTEAFPVENCVKYYYRIRAADDCWDGRDPAGEDPTAGDFSHDNLSPFYPPINPNDPSDTDTLNPGDPAGAAVIGYARPGAKPEQVLNMRLDAYRDAPNNDFFISFDLPKRDLNKNDPDVPDEETHIAVGTLRMYGSHSNDNFAVPDLGETPCANPPCNVGGNVYWYADIDLNTDPTGSNLVYSESGGSQVPLSANDAGILDGRVGHYDEDGDDAGTQTLPASWKVELPFEDESAFDNNGDGDASDAGDTGLRHVLQTGIGNTWYFKVLAVQCKDTFARNNFAPADEDRGEPSDWLQVPCEFGEAINDSAPGAGDGTVARNRSPIDGSPTGDIEINGGSCPSSLPTEIRADVTDDQGDIRACQARLVLRAGISGDVVGSSWKFWSDPSSGNCNEVGTSCPESSSFFSENFFCWSEAEVEDLMADLRGQDITVSVEVRESIPQTVCIFGTCQIEWSLPCIGQEDCPTIVPATDCLSVVEQQVGATIFTFNPVLPQDDFTGGLDPISGDPNGLPDGQVDCYQAAEWDFEEACVNGPLDIQEIRIRWRPESGQCSGDLLRAYWDYASQEDPGQLLFESSGWPTDGNNSGNVLVCDSTETCTNQVTCPPEDCDNGLDDDGDGFTDCNDIDCTGNASCEDCGNGIDDDGDGDVDCDDSDCNDNSGCGGEDCTNGVDDDGDGDIDCADRGCFSDNSCFGDLGCLLVDEAADVRLRMEFDEDPDNAGDPTCDDSMKDAEIQVEITYRRTNLSGSVIANTQTFSFSPTQPPVPDPCNSCDKDNDGVVAQTGLDENGDPCGGDDCDDLDPDIGAASNCCDTDGDGFERLDTLEDGTQCGNTNKGTCDDGTGTGSANDCDDTDANISPNATESNAAGNCADMVDNDCDCAVDGSPVEFDIFECRT